MRLPGIIILYFFCCLQYPSAYAQHISEVSKGLVSFNSTAPNEIIRASSDKLNGAIDIGKNTFAFKVEVTSFKGFNSPLQKEHFNENYMESDVYPFTNFSGKIIEDIDLKKKGIYNVRAKGKIYIHGISRERIINAKITVSDAGISIHSAFTVPLADHNIKIPRVVNDKLATDINIIVTAILKAVK